MSGPTDDLGRPLTVWGTHALVALATCDAIGHKCAVNGGACSGMAVALVPWPGREPIAQCEHHFEWTLHVAGTFQMADLIRAGARPLDVVRRNTEPEDPSAARFAAMELS